MRAETVNLTTQIARSRRMYAEDIANLQVMPLPSLSYYTNVVLPQTDTTADQLARVVLHCVSEEFANTMIKRASDQVISSMLEIKNPELTERIIRVRDADDIEYHLGYTGSPFVKRLLIRMAQGKLLQPLSTFEIPVVPDLAKLVYEEFVSNSDAALDNVCVKYADLALTESGTRLFARIGLQTAGRLIWEASTNTKGLDPFAPAPVIIDALKELVRSKS